MTTSETLPAENAGGRGFEHAGEGGYHRLSFTGSGSEYFGIWIVNILLTIVTLGIYSAWAKVRRNRYFYGNTILLGRGFEYHARGSQIFIGRLLAVIFLVLYNVVVTLLPVIGLIIALPLLFFVPWLIARGLRFRARVTSYRNVRFDFVGHAGGAFIAFIVGPLLATITFGILVPFASRWLYRYIGNNLRYGQKAFSSNPTIGPIYMKWLVAAAVLMLGMLISSFLFVLGMTSFGFWGSEGTEFLSPDLQTSTGFILLLTYVFIFVIFALAALVYRAGVRNIAWSASTFDGKHRLLSDLSPWRYIWIAASNQIVTLVTLGLMRPWAAVRMARYVNEHTGVRFEGDVGEIFSRIAEEGSAMGAEFMDIEGFDVGF